MNPCFISFKLAKEMLKIEIAYSFIENTDFFFLLGFNPLILMLFVKLYKQKGKMKGKIFNMTGKIQIEVKDIEAYCIHWTCFVSDTLYRLHKKSEERKI